MSKVIIIGGGAAGMLASVYAARNGHSVTVYEKNEKLGKKVYITGKGRCNVTNACDNETFFEQIVSNPRFLYSAFYKFNNYDVMDLFEELGMPVKIERGNRVFPVSDKSSDVIQALRDEMKRLGVEVVYHTEVTKICEKDGAIEGVCINNQNKVIKADAVMVATGGLSYPSTGSDGAGYRFAKDIGHSVTKLYPSLVPVHVSETFVADLMGLSLKNIEIRILSQKKELYHDFGEMLFTHFGVSGPVILSGSSYIVKELEKNELQLKIDLKPALTYEQLDSRLLRDFEPVKNKQFKNGLDQLLPKKLIDVIIYLSGIDPEKKIHDITKEERLRLGKTIKEMTLHITKLGGYNQAVITKGGVKVSEINPSTMESKLCNNLYFIGEVLDLDALTGGFNLQIAWSTAYAAANAIV